MDENCEYKHTIIEFEVINPVRDLMQLQCGDPLSSYFITKIVWVVSVQMKFMF